jgi:glycerol uptake facilitator-like aquaporin
MFLNKFFIGLTINPAVMHVNKTLTTISGTKCNPNVTQTDKQKKQLNGLRLINGIFAGILAASMK